MSSIAIIEHDDLMRALLEEYLGDAGYRVYSTRVPKAPDGEQPDLVIVDIYMPRSTGVETLENVRIMHPGTPLVAISGQFCSGLVRCGATAHRLGVQRIIAKPFDRDELLEAVRAVIGAPV